ncbi:MAG TPA: hypothetical protein VIV60_06565, partial [Polyangiaceae bacterium]
MSRLIPMLRQSSSLLILPFALGLTTACASDTEGGKSGVGGNGGDGTTTTSGESGGRGGATGATTTNVGGAGTSTNPLGLGPAAVQLGPA